MKELNQGEPRTYFVVEIFKSFEVFSWEQGREPPITHIGRKRDLGSQTHSMTLEKVQWPCLGFYFPDTKHSTLLRDAQILSN